MHSKMEHSDQLTILIISCVSMLTLISALAACLCCRKKNHKSELAGLEGIVKLKHLDDNTLTVDVTDSCESVGLKSKTLPVHTNLNENHDYELKRSSNTAPHRSLPDIPIVETVCDNNSEIYATVGDKFQGKAAPNQKHLPNISNVSSFSQADDVSSPYARVKSPAHAYDKLKKAEHPYAQVVQAATTGGIAQVVVENDDDDIDEDDETRIENPISHRESSSNNDLLETDGAAIDVSAAINGLISASQELPYMTPPIASIVPTQQHFSGDSQDSSKGYTSISVREPLANIIAQTKQQNVQRRRNEIQDSHYATVSDDSDEMYAAIEDQNLYTSGSETYAQIQAPMVVAVEINTSVPPPNPQPTTSQSTQTNTRHSRVSASITQSNPIEDSIAVTNAEALKNLHSRQASSSSCTSSVGIIGSPKPEKRQANSPLPPTPKSQHKSRNSVSSLLEFNDGTRLKDSNNNSSKIQQSPSKDLEGMYAKVMKKNKLSSVPSENSSPVLSRHEQSDEVNRTPEIPVKETNAYETIDKNRSRQRSDAGYETIADHNNNKKDHSASHYAKIGDKGSKAKMSLFQEKQQQNDSIDDPKYEKLKQDGNVKKAATNSNAADSDYDPNYEIVMNQKESKAKPTALPDDGYSKIEKSTKELPGYSVIQKPEPDYSSIAGDNQDFPSSSIIDIDSDSNIYSSIPTVALTPSSESNSSELPLGSTTNSLLTPTSINNNYESLSNSEGSTTIDEPNYESVKCLNENPYERLSNGKGSSPDPALSQDDFFKV